MSHDNKLTRSGTLILIDMYKTLNLGKNEKHIQENIRLQLWKPRNICRASPGYLLVVLNSNDYRNTKFIRNSGSTNKQTIQFNNKGKPMYSYGSYYRYIKENMNLYMCMSDGIARSVLRAQEPRLTCTVHQLLHGNNSISDGIITDSRNIFVTVEYICHCIYILDQGGQFLRYIYNCL